MAGRGNRTRSGSARGDGRGGGGGGRAAAPPAASLDHKVYKRVARKESASIENKELAPFDEIQRTLEGMQRASAVQFRMHKESDDQFKRMDYQLKKMDDKLKKISADVKGVIGVMTALPARYHALLTQHGVRNADEHLEDAN